MTTECKNAASGCNYPEGECLGVCMVGENSMTTEQKLREALERIADPRNTHFAGDAQVVAREALSQPEQQAPQPLDRLTRLSEEMGLYPWQEPKAGAEPVAKVLFRQDDDGLEPVMFYGPGSEPDPTTLKERFVLLDVWLTPQPPAAQKPLTDDEANRLCKVVGAVYAPDGFVRMTPQQYRDALATARYNGLRAGERAHGITAKEQQS